MLPYGNARGVGSSVMCQHGPQECNMNMVEACAIKHLANAVDYMPFIFCAESQKVGQEPEMIINKCSKDEAVAGSIKTCYDQGKGKEGIDLISEYANKTQALHHKYTPWVAIDGVHSTGAEDNLKKAVCAAYKGSNPPAACAKYTRKRCFRDDVLHELFA